MKKYTWIFVLLCAMALVFAVSCGDPGDDPPPIKFEAGEIFKDGKFNPAVHVDVEDPEAFWDMSISGKNLLAGPDGGMNFEVDATGFTKLIIVAPGVNVAVEGELWGDIDDVIVVGETGNWAGLNQGYNGNLTFPLNGNTELYGFMFSAFGDGKTEITITKIYLSK